VINPVMSRMIEAGNRPVLKIYLDTGHFIQSSSRPTSSILSHSAMSSSLQWQWTG
jgi:hypothetical protein